MALSVPVGESYTVSFGEVEGYKTPESVSFTSIDDNARMVDAVYYAEHVTVNVSTDNGASVDGSEVIVSKRKRVPNGVYIQDINGELWTESEWDGSVTPNGIAVVSDECNFVIALIDTVGYLAWSNNETLVEGISTSTSNSNAEKDYDGEAQTTAILNQLGNNSTSAPAAYHCRAYTFPNGAVGYLGAAGEWKAALDNKSAITSALTKCGGASMSSMYWTSTQDCSDISWLMFWDVEALNGSYKHGDYQVRAFSAL